MRAVRWVIVMAVVAFSLVACGSSKTTVMPNVTGQRLDHAKSALKDAGIDDKPKYDGGGTFGPLIDSNWTVCSQSPAAGATVDGAPTLTIDRSCDTDSSSASLTATPTATVTVTETPTPSTTPTPTETPTPTQPPSVVTSGVITPQNSPDFAKMLADGSGDCDGHTASFARAYANRKIRFNGVIADIEPHNGDQTVYDILVNAKLGVGPQFKFDGVSTYIGDDNDGEWKLTNNSASPAVGKRVRIVATVDNFNAQQCLFYLDPVSTTVK